MSSSDVQPIRKRTRRTSTPGASKPRAPRPRAPKRSSSAAGRAPRARKRRAVAAAPASGGVSVLKVALGVFLGCGSLVVLGVGGCMLSVQMMVDDMEEQAATLEAEYEAKPVSGVSHAELLPSFGVGAGLTVSEREHMWSVYEGAKVRWDGTVVESYEAFGWWLKVEVDPQEPPVYVRLAKDAQTSVPVGTRVTVEGELTGWEEGGLLTLDRGRVVGP